MIKKILIALSLTLCMAGNAQANFLSSPYVGIDAGISLFNGTRLPFNVHLGTDLTKINDIDLDAEVYLQSYANNSSFSHFIVGIDALAYPIPTSDIHFFGGLGLSYHNYSLAGEFGLNIMGGARYDLNKDISLRARAKYFIAPGNLDLTIGASYNF